MAGRLGSALRRRFSLQPSAPEVAPVVNPAPPSSLGLRLTGDPQVLDRLVEVRPDTVAVLFPDEKAPRLAYPGERLKPRVLPGVNPLHVLVVNTAPVSLEVSMARLSTLDGFDIERTTIRLVLELVPDDQFACVLELAARFGPGMEAQLLRRVEDEVVSGVQGAVRTNRLADVRRLTLAGLLENRWLPESFAGGALVRREFTVLGVVWPPEPAAAMPSPVRDQSRPPAAAAGRGGPALHTDRPAWPDWPDRTGRGDWADPAQAPR